MTTAEPADRLGWSCARCGRPLERGRDESYVVEIRAVADPAPPRFDEADLARDTESAIADLLLRLGAMTQDQLAEQVYRRRLFLLCPACYARWTDDPFGEAPPRTSR